MNQPQSISIVIPTLNEAGMIETVLSNLLQTKEIEIIVVDGGSQDQTVAVAESFGVKVIGSERGRAKQMNAGAKLATGKILLFLHADTRLPEGFVQNVRSILAIPETTAGAFGLRIEGSSWRLRWIEWGVNWRSRYLQMPYGDQAIFLQADVFDKIGGFPDLPIMEDFELVRRLRKRGRVAIASTAVVTSGRRWERLGIFRTTLMNQIAIAAYLLGAPPAQIAAWYRDRRR